MENQDTTQEVTQEAEVNMTENEAQQLTITLNDLGVLANIINLATTRGAFKANELSSVGAAYDKLATFLAAAQAQAPATDTSKETV